MEEKQEGVKEKCRTVYLKNDKYIIELEKGRDSGADVIKIGVQRSLLSKILLNFKDVKEFLTLISSIISNTKYDDLMKNIVTHPEDFPVNMIEEYFSYDADYLKHLLRVRETNLRMKKNNI